MLLTHFFKHHKLVQRKPLMLLNYYTTSTTNWCRESY